MSLGHVGDVCSSYWRYLQQKMKHGERIERPGGSAAVSYGHSYCLECATRKTEKTWGATLSSVRRGHAFLTRRVFVRNLT